MKRKFVVGILSLACLTSLVVFGSASEFVGMLAESMPSIPITHIFTVSPEQRQAQAPANELEKTTAVEGSVEEIPETIIWQAVFRLVQALNIEADKSDQRGEDGNLYRNYFIRQGSLSIEHNAVLKEISSAYLNEIGLLDQKAQKLADEAREKNGTALSEPPKELGAMQRQKDDLTLHYRDQFKNAVDDEAFSNFTRFLRGDFSTGIKKIEIDNPVTGAPLTNFLNIYLYYDLNVPTVSGMTEVILDYDTGFYYHPKAKSWLDNATTGQNMHFAQHQGYRWTTPARAWNATFTAIRGWTYCVYGEMWWVDVNFLSDQLAEHYITSYEGCYTFPLPPTPTPTPTPFPTPTPCEPLNGLPCQTPTPTPTPTSTPQATISQFEVVEKHGTVDINVIITNPTGVNTLVSFRGSSGSGVATFADGSATKVYSGNQRVTLKVKGVTESTVLDGIFLEVKNNNVLLASEPFTVAVITSLEFERFDSTYIDLDNNPGNGEPGTNVGQRIYPDKRPLVPADTIDRSLVKVKANVLPAASNLKVYFGSFDLDDPSANVAPIDTNLSDGKDNNGLVNNSKSGDFTAASGCANGASGTAPNHISKIECTTASDGTVSAVFKTTMNPGDNFALAATVNNIYRDGNGTDNGLLVNASDGSQIINSALQSIPISGEANPNGVAGIRTNMLTVWRRLYMEVDSMENVGTTNKITGTITSVGQTPCPPTPQVPPCVINTGFFVSTLLDQARFNNGRITIAPHQFSVLTNETGAVILNGNPQGANTIRPGSSFTLYDDDDYNDDDGTTKDGDNSEPFAQLPESFRYLSDADGNHPDGRPRNLYASAYIRPEYNWAQNIANYNQINLPFVLNTGFGSNLDTVLNANRNSTNSERDDFWIAYFLVGYQGDLVKDADGVIFNTQTNSYDPEPGVSGVGRSATVGCDCYQAGTCIGTSCQSTVHRGAIGSLIFQEVMQDVRKTWLRDGGLVIHNMGTTGPHELGHQFGLRGDNEDPSTGLPTRPVSTYMVMDYPHRPAEADEYSFHPEHINVMRKRVSSPGN